MATIVSPAVFPPVAPASAAVAERRVLHVMNGEFFAGAERVQDLLALHLPEFGFEVTFACIKADLFPRARRSTGPLLHVPMRWRGDLRPAKQLARVIREQDIAVVHAHTPRSLLIGRFAAAWAGVPLVYHIHSQTTTEVGRRLGTWLNTWMERLCLRRASAVIAVSPSARQFAARQGVLSDHLHFVANGIAIPDFVTRPVPHDVWTLAAVALFRPRKGLEVLLKAVSLLRKQGAPVRLKAIGPFETPEYEREIRALTEDLGIADAVTWTGFTQNVTGELETVDLFAFPSILPEGMPMVLLEALAAGLPVIASRVEGVTDVLPDDSVARLVPPNDPQALCAAVNEAISRSETWPVRRRMAYDYVSQRFSARAMAEGVARLYRQVLPS